MPDFPKPSKKFEDVCAVPTADLIEAYRGSIDMLRAALSKEIEAHKPVEKADPNFGDDLHLLRYVLSHHKSGIDKAEKAMRKTMVYRAEHADTLFKVRVERQAPPKDDAFRTHMLVSPHFRSRDGHLVYLIRNGVGNTFLALDHMTPDEVTQWMTLSKEFLHAVCDDETRAQGKLVKMIFLMDFKYGSLTGVSGKFKDAMQKASKESELFYPQLMKRTALFNMPYVISSVLGFLLRFFPKSLQEKLVVCNEDDPVEMAAWAEKNFNLDMADLPSYLGGKCDCHGGCIVGFPNEQPGQLTVEGVAARRERKALWDDFMGKTVHRAAYCCSDKK